MSPESREESLLLVFLLSRHVAARVLQTGVFLASCVSSAHNSTRRSGSILEIMTNINVNCHLATDAEGDETGTPDEVDASDLPSSVDVGAGGLRC